MLAWTQLIHDERTDLQPYQKRNVSGGGRGYEDLWLWSYSDVPDKTHQTHRAQKSGGPIMI